MSKSDFLDFVLEQLKDVGRVRSRRMFGGYGIYADDLFFAIVADDVLYLKVDDSNRSDYERYRCRPFAPFDDPHKVILSYYNVPADVLEDREELAQWARKSIAIALSAASAQRSLGKKPAKKSSEKKPVKKPAVKKKSGASRVGRAQNANTRKKSPRKQSSQRRSKR